MLAPVCLIISAYKMGNGGPLGTRKEDSTMGTGEQMTTNSSLDRSSHIFTAWDRGVNIASVI